MSRSPLDLTCVADVSTHIEDGPFPCIGSPARQRAIWRCTASVLALAAVAFATSATMQQAMAAPGTPGETNVTFPLMNGPVTGGVGGTGASGGTSSNGGAGDAGGDGVIAIGAAGDNTVNITGGAGGTGGQAVTLVGGVGGTGGRGLVFSGSDALTNAAGATIRGGNGGGGGSAGTPGAGGAGGIGMSSSSSATLTNAGEIIGGNGANGISGSQGSAGGNGGGGLFFSATGGTLINTNRVVGGNGGGGKTGGSGAAGVTFTGTGTLTNSGTILGGNGGTGFTSFTTYGVSGAGVVGGDLTIDNRGGTISGGEAGGTRANAITFTGGANTLTLSNTGGLTGNVAIDGAGTLTFNQSTAVTLANVITGNGSLIQNGTGTLALTAANTYSGGTTITSGTLQIGAGGTVGSITGNVTNNSTLAFSRSDSVTFAGTISGSGAVNQVGTGTTILTANSNYSGGTTISGGTLQIGAGGTTGSIIGNVTNNAALMFDRSDALTFSGEISGTGILFKVGAGTTTLTGANTYSGGTYISVGTLQIGDGGTTGTISGNVSNNATLAFNRSDTWTYGGGVIYGTGALKQVGTGTTILTGEQTSTGGTTISAGTLQIGNGGTTGSITGNVTNNATLAFNRSDTLILSGVISGTGAVQQLGTGITIINGTNAYTGATTIDGGTLSVNGDITASSGVTVNASGALGGNGFVGDTTIHGGKLAPGNSIGLLTVQGNLVMTSASTYMVEVSPSNADRVNITGTANLGNATVNASFAPGSYITKQYSILNATGGLGGSAFSTLVNTNLPSSITSALSYDANNVYLNLTLSYAPTSSPGYGGGLSGNQGNVGNALTGFFNRTGGIPLAFGALDAKGLSQVSGELAPGSKQTSFDVVNIFMTQMTDPFAAGRDIAPTVGAVPYADTMAYAGKRAPTDAFASMSRKAPPIVPAFHERWNVWAAGFGGSQTTDGNAGAGTSKSSSSIYGAAVGADYWFSPFTVAGFSMAGGGTNFAVDGAGSGRSDLFQLGGFVRHTMGSIYVSAAAAYGWQDITTDRYVTVAGIDHLRANFNANSYSGRFEAGNRFATPWIGGLGLTPYGAVQVTAFDLPSYAESAVSGASTFALAYGGKTTTATRTELGLRSDKSFVVTDALLTLRGRAAWAHDYNTDRSASATFQSLPGASFTVNGAAQAANAALTTASAELKWTNGWSVAGTFEGEFSDVTRSYAGKGVVRYAW